MRRERFKFTAANVDERVRAGGGVVVRVSVRPAVGIDDLNCTASIRFAQSDVEVPSGVGINVLRSISMDFSSSAGEADGGGHPCAGLACLGRAG